MKLLQHLVPPRRSIPGLLVAILALGAGISWSEQRPPQEPLRPRVLLVVYDPVLEERGGVRLSRHAGWKDWRSLTRQYIEDVRECSGGFIDYQVVETVVSESFPLKKDGFRYTDSSFLSAMERKSGWHQPDAVDYHAILRDFGVAERVNRDEIDEVWVWAMPYGGFYESIMAGTGAYFCNAPPLEGVKTDRIFVIMGFNYERGVGEMLEDLGHRTESIMRRVYGSWEPKPTHAWNRFTLYDKVAPGEAAAGNIHFAPNSEKDYDWGNPRPVWSTADDWLDCPALDGKKKLMTSADWGSGDIRLHHKWWFTRLPKAPGTAPDGKQANWWKYVVDFNRYAESR